VFVPSAFAKTPVPALIAALAPTLAVVATAMRAAVDGALAMVRTTVSSFARVSLLNQESEP
jgi:hypothetical protein